MSKNRKTIGFLIVITLSIVLAFFSAFVISFYFDLNIEKAIENIHIIGIPIVFGYTAICLSLTSVINTYTVDDNKKSLYFDLFEIVVTLIIIIFIIVTLFYLSFLEVPIDNLEERLDILFYNILRKVLFWTFVAAYIAASFFIIRYIKRVFGKYNY